MKFAYEAITQTGELVQAALEAETREDAAAQLRGKGLMPVKLDIASSEAVEINPGSGRAGLNELCLLCRQLKMLLEAGASLVPALEAVEEQTVRPGFRGVLRRLRRRIETGRTLTEALQEFPRAFNPVFVSMIAAGERSATLPRVFERLGTLLERQRKTRSAITSAAMYPALLGVVSIGVVALLLNFVVPRFKGLFATLNRPLPESTKLLLSASEFVTHYGPILLGAGVGLIVLAVLALRSPQVKRMWDRAVLELPVIGRLMRRLATGRILRVWAAMLAARLPLLEAIEQSRAAASNHVYQTLMDELREAVSSGQKLGLFLRRSRRIDAVIASALSTGEDNGRLAEATEFVSTWLDEDIEQALTRLARLAEPVLLTVLGVAVGAIAMALFLPLFDIATAG